jgi:hypothetical protein
MFRPKADSDEPAFVPRGPIEQVTRVAVIVRRTWIE